MNTWHIHIKGQVQGVGFRPFVFALAQEYGLKGWVNNTVDGVHVVFNAEQRIASDFSNKITTNAPTLSRITASHLQQIEQKFFDNFQIIHSAEEGEPNLLLTPDVSLCEDCREELHQIDNRRQGYPFITCTNCGPRFSIIRSLPYDRIHTTMRGFTMCTTCRKEYDNPLDRRYYSQTNSCSDCGIGLSLFDGKKNQMAQQTKAILDEVVRLLEVGKIVAIKGIGGYLLTCDAGNSAAVSELRKRKHRPSKPFALMLPSVNGLKDFQSGIKVFQALRNHVAPIVLVESAEAADLAPEIAPGLGQLGVMLPYTPLYELLLSRFGKSIVATSGNVSNSPIVYEDKKALDELLTIADYLLVNDREIVIPQDDSVIKFSFFKQHQIILRRSRGLAPTFIRADLQWPKQNILAMGALLKSTFSLLHRGNVFISQYLGDLEHFDTQQSYQHTLQHFLDMFRTQPDVILCDRHPGYPSTQLGEQLAQKWGIPVKQIQHHIAHFGAVIGEHNLIHSEEPVLGVIWDGTGLGDDAQIWGGEFFIYEHYEFSRCCFFDYFDFILGDKMPKEPRIAALSACWGLDGMENLLREKFTPTEWQVYTKLLAKGSRLQTSSVGRLFDALASLLGIMDKQTYEGEAAMRLEALATAYFKKEGLDFQSSYCLEEITDNRISTPSFMSQIIADLRQGKSKGFIAAKFHFSLMQIIKMVANNLKIKKIAFSGGVFQNSMLTDLILHHLGGTFELYFHQELSPNDENISFGQLVCYQIENLKNHHKSNHYVFSDSRQNKIH